MTTYLVLVADQARARLFTTQSRTGALTEFQGLANPQGRMREQDLVSDSRGGNPHDIGNHGDIQANIAEGFAREVAHALDAALTQHHPDRIYVVAPPQFLGMLRKHQSTAVKNKLAQELSKDFSHMQPDEIRAHLPELL